MAAFPPAARARADCYLIFRLAKNLSPSFCVLRMLRALLRDQVLPQRQLLQHLQCYYRWSLQQSPQKPAVLAVPREESVHLREVRLHL